MYSSTSGREQNSENVAIENEEKSDEETELKKQARSRFKRLMNDQEEFEATPENNRKQTASFNGETDLKEIQIKNEMSINV